ncbi:MAG TPA: LysE family transporter [Dongiaceae bacterium]|nr:LysE family transporter [Dongiaceae bacterium]
MAHAVLLSFAVGFFTASPLGPIGLLCLRRALFQSYLTGMLSALGIASAYFFWAFATVRGLASFASWIESEQVPLELGIGVFFLLYGLNAILNPSRPDQPAAPKPASGVVAFGSTFLVVFLNPVTFFMFTAGFTVLGIAKGHARQRDALEIAAAVFLGAVLFWLSACYVAGHLKRKLGDGFFQKLHRISAFIIVAFGVILLMRAMW